MSKNSTVALAHGKDVQENVTRVFDMMGGVTKMIEPNSTVVLKPNAGHAAPPEFAVCTHPETVRAVIREVKKANPKRIVIAEAAAVGCDTIECYEACGIAKVAEEEGVELVDIKRDKDLINVAVRGYRSNISHVKLPRLLLEAEHIINLPILKAHASMVFSGALKNIKGVVQDQVHTTMHRQNLTMAMMDVWSVCRPDLNIMDVMSAASGYSPHTPTPIELDCVMGSKDPVALDRMACELVGIDPDGVSYFKVADEVGLGTTNPDHIEVVGDKLADCYKKMWVPYLEDIRNRWPEYDVHCEGACSSCQALLTLNMETLKAIGIYDENKGMTVVAGCDNKLDPNTPDKQIILHGNCTRRHLKEHPDAYFLPGCPPGEGSLYMTVVRKEPVTGQPELMPWIRQRMEDDAPAWRGYVEKEAEKFYGSNK
ncbi:DUF362 domain-containing protein [Flavonifractor sp. An4]|uniref:DUF362 domain-containing protein n=1 Tax=Flavonifractor sp. An4 TaxID=1965634 RepID=UPI000B3A77C1|nr:DUF362 domain-containing protein [Flavonifractor sp. An4]OUO17916.1 hypothetical protein B5F94_00530 [Flavonifractor sp. An4]